MSGAQQVSFMNQRSFGPPPLRIGDPYQGGFYAGLISAAATGNPSYSIVVAPLSSGQNASRQFKTTQTSTVGTDSVWNGLENSGAMNNASHPAGQFCEGLTIGGFSDWYLPAKNELEICYFNLKPSTTSNNTTRGANPNAVPPRASNYTAGTPAQTSATAFQSGGSEAFTVGIYWSSTQNGASFGNTILFSTGYSTLYSKTTSRIARAARRGTVPA